MTELTREELAAERKNWADRRSAEIVEGRARTLLFGQWDASEEQLRESVDERAPSMRAPADRERLIATALRLQREGRPPAPAGVVTGAPPESERKVKMERGWEAASFEGLAAGLPPTTERKGPAMPASQKGKPSWANAATDARAPGGVTSAVPAQKALQKAGSKTGALKPLKLRDLLPAERDELMQSVRILLQKNPGLSAQPIRAMAREAGWEMTESTAFYLLDLGRRAMAKAPPVTVAPVPAKLPRFRLRDMKKAQQAKMLGIVHTMLTEDPELRARALQARIATEGWELDESLAYYLMKKVRGELAAAPASPAPAPIAEYTDGDHGIIESIALNDGSSWASATIEQPDRAHGTDSLADRRGPDGSLWADAPASDTLGPQGPDGPICADAPNRPRYAISGGSGNGASESAGLIERFLSSDAPGIEITLWVSHGGRSASAEVRLPAGGDIEDGLMGLPLLVPALRQLLDRSPMPDTFDAIRVPAGA